MVRGMSGISVPVVSQSMARGGKMFFPVDSSSLIYSYFKHVSGFAAPNGSEGVSISKLKLLDVLIGRLNQIKRSGVSPFAAEGNLEALIETYKTQIKQAEAASAAMPYISSPSSPGGALFSLAV